MIRHAHLNIRKRDIGGFVFFFCLGVNGGRILEITEVPPKKPRQPLMSVLKALIINIIL